MRIVGVEDRPWAEVPCVFPTARGGQSQGSIPILCARAKRMPAALGGVLLASDLQARELCTTTDRRPIGVVVAEFLEKFLYAKKLDAATFGVILAGDLYTSPTLHRRFGVGDISEVWDAFQARFRWVTGVLGNVDRMPKKARKRHLLLQGSSVELNGLKIAGISGIIGPSKMENRRPEREVLRELQKVLNLGPDILVLHEGPSIPGEGFRGSDAIRQALRDYAGTVVCGHNTWPQPLVSLRRACVVNTDGRCLIVRAR